jgi:ribonucleoside-diphosphate reductase alpha chain
MDCDTTGIEPDIALVKYKLLAGEGEGMMKIVNRSVPNALERLGYTDDERDAIIAYIDDHDTIEGAPHLKAEHLPVFDCAFKPHGGERSIHHLGHIKMMAAVQPFVSGAISKTVNMPEDVTTDDIYDAYVKGWELGLKAIAIYRENSKRSQPLSTSEDGNTKQGAKHAETAQGDPAGDGAAAEADLADAAASTGTPGDAGDLPHAPRRKRLPDERPSLTHKFSVAGHEGYITIGLYPDTHQPGELFITMAKQGSTLAGVMDAFATSVSIALQYGVPLEDLCRKFSHMRFEPSGFTNNEQIPIAKSITDYIFRYLSIKFLDRETAEAMTQDPETADPTEAVAAEASRRGPAQDAAQGELDFGALGQPSGEAPTGGLVGQTVEAFLATSQQAEEGRATTFQNQDDAPPCPECGSITVRSGACYACPNCGASTGCG